MIYDYTYLTHALKKECFLEIRLPEQLFSRVSRGSFAETTTARGVLYPGPYWCVCVYTHMYMHATHAQLTGVHSPVHLSVPCAFSPLSDLSPYPFETWVFF